MGRTKSKLTLYASNASCLPRRITCFWHIGYLESLALKQAVRDINIRNDQTGNNSLTYILTSANLDATG